MVGGEPSTASKYVDCGVAISLDAPIDVAKSGVERSSNTDDADDRNGGGADVFVGAEVTSSGASSKLYVINQNLFARRVSTPHCLN